MRHFLLLALLLSSCFCNPLSGNYQQCCEPDWTFKGEWLYWKTRRSGLEYAYENADFFTEDMEDFTCLQGEQYNLNPDYNSGYRVRITKELCPPLTLGIGYVNYRNKVSRNLTFPEGEGTLVGTRFHPNSGRNVAINNDIADSEYKIQLDIVDGELSTKIRCFDNKCVVAPLLGFRYEYIDQKMNTTYQRLALNDSSTINERVEMKGYGAFSGISSEYFFNDCFAFWGRSVVGLLAGDFCSTFVETDQGIGVCDTYREQWQGITELELALGIRFRFFELCCVPFWLDIGYEFHQWVNLPDFMQFHDNVAIGNTSRHTSSLMIDGVTVGLQADF